jgi:hypothetical protein
LPIGSWVAAIALLVFQLIRRYPKRVAIVWVILIVLGVVVSASKPQPPTPTSGNASFPALPGPVCTYIPDPYAQPGGIDWGKVCTPMYSVQPSPSATQH